MTRRAGWSRQTCGIARLCGAFSLVVAAASTSQAQLRSGVLTAIQGEVTIERAAQASAQAPELPHAVVSGDQVRTGDRALAHLSFRRSADLLVEENTALRIEPDERGVAITIERGHVAALLRAESAELRMSNMIVNGAGTFVEIAVDRGRARTETARTTICVLYGETHARARAGDTITVGTKRCAALVDNVWEPVRSAQPAEIAWLRAAWDTTPSSTPETPDPMQIEALRHACEAVDPRACSDLGALYYETRGRARDSRGLAAEYFRQGCLTGDTFGCRALAIMYARGEGLPRRPALAAELYGRACGGGDADACVALAEMYEAGWARPSGVPPVALLYQRACDLGAARACGP